MKSVGVVQNFIHKLYLQKKKLPWLDNHFTNCMRSVNKRNEKLWRYVSLYFTDCKSKEAFSCAQTLPHQNLFIKLYWSSDFILGSGKLLSCVGQFTPGIIMCLQRPLLIGSHFPVFFIFQIASEINQPPPTCSKYSCKGQENIITSVQFLPHCTGCLWFLDWSKKFYRRSLVRLAVIPMIWTPCYYRYPG